MDAIENNRGAPAKATPRISSNTVKNSTHKAALSQTIDEAKRRLPSPGLQALATAILGVIDWQDATTGFCRCPGQHLHTHQNGKRDCKVWVDRVPTVKCVHASCGPEIERVNHQLRSAIGKASMGSNPGANRYVPTPEDRERHRQQAMGEQLKARAVSSLPAILNANKIGPSDFWEMSPVRLLDGPADDWRLLLQLFQPHDVVWIGGLYDSCGDDATESRKEFCRRHFRTVADWLIEPHAPEQHTCPCVFKPGAYSRSQNAVTHRRFLVTESDILSKPEMCAVFRWCRQFMRLRAIVDTGGKSFHAWFDAPPPEIESELRIILPTLKMDKSLFDLAHPCRLPGAWREPGKLRQALLYLDLEAAP